MVNLTNLTWLELQFCELADLSPLLNLKNLRSLDCLGNKISDIGPLAGLIEVAWLQLSHNQISDIGPLAGMTNLTTLELCDDRIEDVSPLAGLTNLRWLGLWSNQIADVSPLAGLTNLTDLWLSRNRLTDISPLAGLRNLVRLELGDDCVNLDGVEVLQGDNQISDVSPLAGLTALIRLDLTGNQVSDIGPLAGLTNLAFLRLYDNWLTDIQALTGLTKLAELWLAGNPLPARACAIDIPLIQANNSGIVIYYDGCTQRWTLTVSSSAGGSVVLPGEGQFQYASGDVVPIQAVLARSSSRFAGWTGSAVTAGKVADPLAMKTTVVMDGDYSLEATFVEQVVPTTGFSLGELSLDNPQQFEAKIATNNTPEQTFVEYVAGAQPDPSGMMRMRPLEGEPAIAKSSFGRSDAQQVLVRFSYLFERSAAGLELVAYLSDVPQLPDLADPRRAEHYVEIGRIAVPPQGRPGSVGSGRFGVFEQWASTDLLDISGGLWVELELVESGSAVNSTSLSLGDIRLASAAADGGSVLIDDWAVEVHCDGICMDLNWSDTVDEEDFLLVIASCGRPAGLVEGGVGSRACLDGAFSKDGYVDAFDIGAWDWALKDSCRCACGSFCRVPLPLIDAAEVEPRALSVLGSRTVGSVFATADPPEGLLILGKRQSTTVFKDGFYSFAEDASYLSNYTHAALSDRCNLRLVRGPSGQLCVLNSETGVVELGAAAKTVIPIGRAACASEPRYHQAATVYVGIQGASSNAFGRPVLDVAFDSTGNAYVVPVVVQPAESAPYVAASRLQLQPSTNPPYRVVQLYDEPPLPGDNQSHDHVREIEIDAEGNVYVLNAHSLNEADILFKYHPNGTVQRLGLMDPRAEVRIRDPIALHVSADAGLIYLASAQRNAGSPDAVIVYGLSKDDFSLRRTVVIEGLQHVTDITEEPDRRRLYVVGFNMIEPVPQYPNPLAPPFYYPCLAVIPPDSDAVEAVPLSGSGNHDLVLPVSLVWTGATP